MPWGDIAAFNLTLLCTSLAAALLAMVLLAIEFFASKWLAERAPGAMAVALVGVALATCWLKGAFWFSTGSASLAALLLVAWPVCSDAGRQQIGRVFTPKVVWALVLGVSMIASRFLAAQVLHSFEQVTPPQTVDLEDVPVLATQAITDKGRAVSLFHFKMYSTDGDVERFMQGTEKDRSQVIRLQEPNPASNCHGWVFTNGRYGIRDTDVAAILSDNGYVAVDEPREGDVAVYANADKITHSGLVRMADRHAPVLIESKWGPFGVYLHATAAQPFSGICKFYRSPRPSHALELEAAGSASREPIAADRRSAL
jgi:hypothetical protein